ncbi:MAG: Fe-S cluster assembly ATPase SufC [Actinomycetota bacterium]|nr:Fe-S cluster assembly ATPase SufC [Actinomycetota bacterium]
MSELVIEQLRAAIGGQEILRGVDLVVRSGEVHAVMGPNGAGKSTLAAVLMGHPSYAVLDGSVRLDGVELLGLPTWKRAAAGLYLAPQDPVEIPGVPIHAVLTEALKANGREEEAGEALTALLATEAADIGLIGGLLDRPLNVGASGGERKRVETLQLAALRPRFALLDELDSGLDVDALRQVARRVAAAVRPSDGSAPLGVLAITHYRRLLDALLPDAVHVLVHGRVAESGGAELAAAIERDGYAAYLGEQTTEVVRGGGLDDLFAH